MKKNFDVVIIGGGILGTSISYFLTSLNKSKKIAVIEQSKMLHFILVEETQEKFMHHICTILKKRNYLQKQHFMDMKCGKNMQN